MIPSPSTIDDPASLLSALTPVPPKPQPQRNGKIARLPKETRDMINLMLDDGLPYHVIIEEIGEAGEGLNTQNLTNWKQGGYQDWLRNQEFIDRARAQAEAVADIVKELGVTDTRRIMQVCHQVAATQLFSAIWEYGDDAVKKIIFSKPENYFRLLNILCRLSDAHINIENFQQACESTNPGSSPIKLDQAPKSLPAPGAPAVAPDANPAST